MSDAPSSMSRSDNLPTSGVELRPAWTLLATQTRTLPSIVRQHVEESAVLSSTRLTLVQSPHVRLRHLWRLDDRLLAHLDGLAVAGEDGCKVGGTALETPGVGEVFCATVRAIEQEQIRHLNWLFSLVETLPEAKHGLVSAFGWVSAERLQGITKEQLCSNSPLHREIGVATCAMHRVDAGATLKTAVTDDNEVVRARGLRTAGALGLRELLPICLKALTDEKETCRFWAAWSGALLGERSKSTELLREFAVRPFATRGRALLLVLKALELPLAHQLLRSLARDHANQRVLLQGAGIAGDPHYVPWLIKQMEDLKLTRLAGESFSFITGLDLAYLDLERRPPEGVELGPTDNPEDEDVAMDPDDGLPWPDPAKIKKWWEANKHRFQPSVRYFMGEPVNVENCKRVLRDGYQRQRIAAALYLSLLQPGTPLFPTSAPAWRQQRWLAKMG